MSKNKTWNSFECILKHKIINKKTKHVKFIVLLQHDKFRSFYQIQNKYFSTSLQFNSRGFKRIRANHEELICYNRRGDKGNMAPHNTWGPPSTRIRIFFKTHIHWSVLALRPHVDGVFVDGNGASDLFENDDVTRLVFQSQFHEQKLSVIDSSISEWTEIFLVTLIVWIQIFSKTDK